MSNVMLTPKASYCIDLLNLPQDKKAAVRSCISQYTKPTTAEDVFSWVIFRIKNAVASIFGASVWQTTQKLVLTHTLSQAYEINQARYAEHYKYPDVYTLVQPRAAILISGLFDICLALNEKINAIHVNIEYYDGYIKNYDIKQFLESLKY